MESAENKVPLFSKVARKSTCLLVVLALVCGVSSCPAGLFEFEFDTVTFRQTDAGEKDKGGDTVLRPGIWIDSNIKRTGNLLIKGKAVSRKPYTIRLEFTDSDFRFQSVEVTSARITYEDGEPEKTLKKQDWPLRFPLRKYEWLNSTSTGVVENKANVLGVKIPDVITRDIAFTLVMEGTFVGTDGKRTPFRLKDTFAPETTKKKVPMHKVWEGV